MTRDVKLERGNFDWGAGGYQSPANGAQPGPEPDFVPPHIEKPDLFEAPESDPIPDWARNMLAQLPSLPAPEPEAIPQERVNLDKGTAVFRGHTITLSPEGLSYIQQVLAAEVCRTLVDEQARIVKSLQLTEMQGDSHGGQDMHEVPVTQVTVEQGPPSAGELS